MKVIMKLKKQEEVSSLSKLLSKLNIQITSTRESFKEEFTTAIKDDNTYKLLELLRTPSHTLDSLHWNSEVYFNVGKYVWPSSYDVLVLFPPFAKHIENYTNDMFEGIASGDNVALLAYILPTIDNKCVIDRLSLFIDTHAMKCFKFALNYVCKVATISDFKVIIRDLLNRNIGTLNTDAITAIQQCLVTEKSS